MNAPIPEKLGFQAEVSKLLEIVTHSLYSDRSVFLRELISNASDACDKLRYLGLTDPKLLENGGEFKIRIAIDKSRGTIAIGDNGIGMNREDLIQHLGTIARSGSAQFMQALSDQAKNKDKDLSLIGQFGVGFYSAFMVAEEVIVTTRKAGEKQAWRWQSDGKGEFTITPSESHNSGTEILLKVREDAKEFLTPERLEEVIAKYSDHIALPIELFDGEKERRINQGLALWARPKSEVTPDQYRDFYRHVAHAFDEPWATLHFKVEGTIEYRGLVFIPSARPVDLFYPDRKQSLKLYVKRVFITDHCEELLPSWLRFLKGIIDSEDLALNISREMLQHNPILSKIRGGLVKRVLDELKRKANEEVKLYEKFWENFGAVLKEGLYQDQEHRLNLLNLTRFHSTEGNSLTSLESYVQRMKPGQNAIYYLTADDLATAQKSAQLEGYRAKGIEVLLMNDAIDEFWIPHIGAFEGKPFKSITRGDDSDLDAIATPEEKKQESATHAAGIDSVVAFMKLSLKDEVKDVRLSRRLTESAVCLVAEEGDIDMRLARLLKQHNRMPETQVRVLEINGAHKSIMALADALSNGKSERAAEACHLLLDMARIQEGELPKDSRAFAARLNNLMQAGLI